MFKFFDGDKKYLRIIFFITLALLCFLVIVCIARRLFFASGREKILEQQNLELKIKLSRHGKVDDLVVCEKVFTDAIDKKNSGFFKENIKHLCDLEKKLRAVLFRNKNITKTLTYEWGLVNQQLNFALNKDIKEIDASVLTLNSTELSAIIVRLEALISEVERQLLLWNGIRDMRTKQQEETLRRKDLLNP